MEICRKCSIVYENRTCPLCNLREHDNLVHDFIESKGRSLVRELFAYLGHRKTAADSGAGANMMNIKQLIDLSVAEIESSAEIVPHHRDTPVVQRHRWHLPRFISGNRRDIVLDPECDELLKASDKRKWYKTSNGYYYSLFINNNLFWDCELQTEEESVAERLAPS